MGDINFCCSKPLSQFFILSPERKFIMPKFLKILISILIDFLLIAFIADIVGSYIIAGTFLSRSYPSEYQTTEEAAPLNIVNSLINGRLEPFNLVTSDQVKIQAYYYPPQNGATLILLHGYKSSHVQMIPIARMLMDHGYGVILPNFRGHGGSGGDEITLGKKEIMDVDAAYQFLLQQPEVDSHKIGIFGNSMGASVAILYSASHPEIKATIAQSPFTTMKDVIWRNTEQSLSIPPVLVAPLIQFWIEQWLGIKLDQINPIQKIHAIAPRPVFILMGGKDQMVDPMSGKLLYEAAGEPKQLWYDDQTGHLEFQMKYPHQFQEKILNFINEALE